jgi:hypothetical protein
MFECPFSRKHDASAAFAAWHGDRQGLIRPGWPRLQKVRREECNSPSHVAVGQNHEGQSRINNRDAVVDCGQEREVNGLTVEDRRGLLVKGHRTRLFSSWQSKADKQALGAETSLSN